MKILLLSVGKPHESYISKGVEDFTQRIVRYYPVDWQVIPPVKNAAALPENELKKQEGKQVLQVLQPADFLVLLDERGRQLSSENIKYFVILRKPVFFKSNGLLDL